MPNYCKVAKCPYYIDHDASKSRWKSYISCKIIHDKLGFDVKNVLKFGDIDDIAAWLDMFCCDFRFSDCVYYRAITAYGGDIKNEDSGEKVKKGAETKK